MSNNRSTMIIFLAAGFGLAGLSTTAQARPSGYSGAACDPDGTPVCHFNVAGDRWTCTLDDIGETGDVQAWMIYGETDACSTDCGNICDGDDEAHGNDGADQINGGDGTDVLFGGAHADLVCGGLGDDDEMYGNGAGDELFDDDVTGGTADGGSGSDTCEAGTEIDCESDFTSDPTCPSEASLY